MFKINDKYTNEAFLSKLKGQGVLAFGFGPQLIRFVTHYDFTNDQLNDLLGILKQL
ncbi:MAG: threonine aldolase [Roseivirga sp.]